MRQLEQAVRTAADPGGMRPTPPCLTGATATVVGNKRLVVTASRGDFDRAITDTLVFTSAAGPPPPGHSAEAGGGAGR